MIKLEYIQKHKCRVCLKNRFSKWGSINNMFLYQCDVCKLVFFYPYTTQEELNKYYNNHYHDVRSYNGSTKIGQQRKKMYILDIAELESTIPIGGKFLDVGCAEGVFLSYLNPRWEKYGIDISLEAVARASEKIGVTATTKDLTEFENNYFDVVHLRGVFEHILFPDRFFSTAVCKLKVGGHIVISTTPNTSGIVPKLFREHFRLIIPNEHVNYFSPKTMRVLAKRHDLILVHLTYPYFGTPYCSFWKDLFSIPINLILGRPSPPFWKSIFTAYLKKIS